MDPKRWAQVRDLFDGLLECPPAERDSFLANACGGDEELAAELRAMIASYESSPDFLEPASLRPEAEADTLTGRHIGPYQLLRRIATGGMGSVYAAARTDREYSKVVAIKIVKPGMDSEEILRRFRTERQVLASLEHPNIARLLDGGTTAQGLPYLVMEYVEGTPLDEYCAARESTIPQRLELFLQVCAAVQYAHRNLVIHRDLKPSNILVTVEGVPKLLDFGIAKLIKPEYSSQSLLMTRLNARPMTPDYASPEQVLGQQVTTSSDVYSLGVLLYRLLTGQPPYNLKTYAATEIERAICDTTPDAPSSAAAAPAIRKQLRGDLDVILLCALRKEPHRRYASVEHLADDLRRHLAGLPVTACGDSWRYRLSKFTARHKVGVALAGLFTVTLLAATSVSLYYAQAAQSQKQTALQLAGYMLSDFDNAIRSGATPARKAALQKLAEHLDRVSRASSDPAVRRLMIETYLKIGDLQGGLYTQNLGDLAGSEQSYAQALKLAQAAVANTPADSAAQRDLALAKRRVGNVAATRGDRPAAEQAYRDSERILQAIYDADPSRPEAIQDLVDTRTVTGLMQMQAGDYPAALDTFRAHQQLSERLNVLANGTSQARHNLAYAKERIGEMQAGTGNVDDGFANLRAAIASYEDLLKQNPTSSPAQKDLASASLILARSLTGVKRNPEAELPYRTALRMLEGLARDDPSNRGYQRDLIAALSELAEILAAGAPAEGRELTRRALALSEPLIRQPRPAVHDLHQYAWIQVTTSFPELRNPAAALEAARQAAALTRERSPAVLDVLARALDASGSREEAAAAERKAIALLPPGASSLRGELETNLAKFSVVAAGAKKP